MTYPYKQTQPAAPEPAAAPEPKAHGPAANAAKKWLVGALIAIIAIIVLTVLVVGGEHETTPPPTTPTPTQGALPLVSDRGDQLSAKA